MKLSWENFDAKSLQNMDIVNRLAHCPYCIIQIAKLAQELIQPDAIYLFGSRARGDASEKSDIDLAFLMKALGVPQRSRICKRLNFRKLGKKN